MIKSASLATLLVALSAVSSVADDHTFGPTVRFTKKFSPPDKPLVELRIKEAIRGLSETERKTYADQWKEAERVNQGRIAMPDLDDLLDDMLVREVHYELAVNGKMHALPPLPRTRLSKQAEFGFPFVVFDAALIDGRLFILEKEGRENRLVRYYNIDKPGSSEPVSLTIAYDDHFGGFYGKGAVEKSAKGGILIRLGNDDDWLLEKRTPPPSNDN